MIKKKYTILGASGHIGSVISHKLIEEGHQVRLVARSKDRLTGLMNKGGIPFPIFFLDPAALTQSLEEVDAAFTMIPPDYTGPDYREFQNKVGEAITSALQKTKISHVVNLSSVGAHLTEKTGPILGLHEQEKRLNSLESLHVVHLRPSFFMENHFRMIDVIKQQGITGTALLPELKLPMIATQDIATRAAELLLQLDFSGKSTMELLGERDLSMDLTPYLSYI
jgi:uncharacterized protein YbjT (DUF2867 family)